MQENAEGYLINYRDWTRDWAIQKALQKGIVLQSFDWQVIAFVREFYQEYQVMLLTRRLLKFIREHINADFDSIQLQERYTEKPLGLIALLAGLPKPIQCI